MAYAISASLSGRSQRQRGTTSRVASSLRGCVTLAEGILSLTGHDAIVIRAPEELAVELLQRILGSTITTRLGRVDSAMPLTSRTMKAAKGVELR
jgi:hypothetical protein